MEYQYHRDKVEYFHVGRCNCSEHFHRSIEWVYNIETPKTVFVSGERYELAAGDLLLVPPLYPHCFPFLKENRSICVVMPVTYSDVYERYTEGKIPQTLILQAGAVTQDIYAHFLQLADCTDPLLKQGIYTYTLAKFLQNASFAEPDSHERTDVSAEILRYIEQHYAERLTQERLAAEFGYNRNYFSALFKQHVHTGFSSYLNVVRINKAISLLGRYTTAEIAERVGFGNVQSFYQNFKKVTGTTPSLYQKQVKRQK